MARARRAKPRVPRALIGLIVVALLVGGVIAALRFWPGSLAAIGPAASPAAGSTPSAAPSSTAATTTDTPPATPTSSAPAKPSATATPPKAQVVAVLEACQKRVRAADQVLEVARTGIGHWKAHVAAERDAASNKISVKKRQQIFKETRLKGPGDQRRYAEAQRAHESARAASCGEIKGAEAKVAATLSRCRERADAQGPLLRAAAAAMGDWRRHLADMKRSREIHVEDAQRVWLAAYRAAPKNINAYDKALRKFDAPRC